MAQDYVVTMTRMVLGELYRCIPVVRLLREFEGRPQGTGLLPSSRNGSPFDIKWSIVNNPG